MSLLGKILLFVNLLAAAGLAYLTAQDWAKRQEVNGLALRYAMTLTGIPVDEPKAEGSSDEIPVAIETAPGHTATTVSKKLLETHFGGSAPRSQVEEVRAVKRRIDDLVTTQGDDAAKLRALCGGLNAQNQIAQLLMLSDPAQANQKRVALVVGLRAYARAVNEQTAQVEEIVRRVERQMEQDQSRFQDEYEQLKRLALEQDQLLYQQQRVVAGLRDQAAEDDRHVQVRQP